MRNEEDNQEESMDMLSEHRENQSTPVANGSNSYRAAVQMFRKFSFDDLYSGRTKKVNLFSLYVALSLH